MLLALGIAPLLPWLVHARALLMDESPPSRACEIARARFDAPKPGEIVADHSLDRAIEIGRGVRQNWKARIDADAELRDRALIDWELLIPNEKDTVEAPAGSVALAQEARGLMLEQGVVPLLDEIAAINRFEPHCPSDAEPLEVRPRERPLGAIRDLAKWCVVEARLAFQDRRWSEAEAWVARTLSLCRAMECDADGSIPQLASAHAGLAIEQEIAWACVEQSIPAPHCARLLEIMDRHAPILAPRQTIEYILAIQGDEFGRLFTPGPCGRLRYKRIAEARPLLRVISRFGDLLIPKSIGSKTLPFDQFRTEALAAAEEAEAWASRSDAYNLIGLLHPDRETSLAAINAPLLEVLAQGDKPLAAWPRPFKPLGATRIVRHHCLWAFSDTIGDDSWHWMSVRTMMTLEHRRLRRQGTRVLLAFESWEAENGRLPENLEDLGTTWPWVLEIENASGRRYVYRILDDDAHGRGFVLYSVGIDGVDDGGVPGHYLDPVDLLRRRNGVDAVINHPRTAKHVHVAPAPE